jgi:hypothetical protein
MKGERCSMGLRERQGLISEPTLADAIKSIYEAGGYATFMHKYREAVERAGTGAELLRFFLRHILRQATIPHIASLIRARLDPIVAEAKERKCFYFKPRSDPSRHGVIIWFNNDKDVQYSRYIGIQRLWDRYGIYPDTMHAVSVVYGYFYSHGLGLWRAGISKRQ